MSTEPLLLASASQDSTVRFWYPAVQREKCATTRSDMVRCCCFSPSGTKFASGGHDQAVVVSSVDDDGRLRSRTTVVFGKAVLAMCWINDDTVVAGGVDENLYAIDANSGTVIATLSGHTKSVFCVAANDEQHIIVSGSLDSTLRIWSARDFSLLGVDQQESFIYSVALFPDSCSSSSSCRVVAACGGSIIMFSVVSKAGDAFEVKEKMSLALDINSGKIYRVQVAPDGLTFATGADSGTITLWSADGGAKLRKFGAVGVEHPSVRSLSFSADGRVLASGERGGIIRAWDVASGEQIAEIKGHDASVDGLSFVPASAGKS